MATLNMASSGHGDRSENYADGSTIQYNVFPANANGLDKVRQAMTILDNLAAREPASGRCNSYFLTLGGNQTFTGLWQNANVFVNYSPSAEVNFFAACHSNNRDLTLTQWCISTQNRWMIAATLCHELAHAAGAPGEQSHSAERAVQRCYMGQQYDSGLLGTVDTIYRHLRDQYA